MSDEKKNRPDNSQFRQQRLPAWQPVMSPPHVSACLTFLAIVFIPIGIAVVVANDNISENEFRYDDIQKCTSTVHGSLLQVNISGNVYSQGCKTVVNFTLGGDVAGPVYMYYKLTNFYQNHRRYAKSRDTQQIAGKDVGEASTDCDPILKPGGYWGKTDVAVKVNEKDQKYGNMQYSPCGLVAWSMFNDSFRLSKVDKTANTATMLCDTSYFTRDTNQPLSGLTVNMSCEKKGITWSSDYDKFVVPHMTDSTWTGNRSAYGQDRYTSDDPYLQTGYYAFEPGHPVPVTTDEDFMVWMRTASLPTFRKLFRIFPNGLKKGDYMMEISEFFDSQQYNGEKYFVLSTVSWVGAKNVFLGFAYIVVGAICAVCAIAFFIVHKVTGDRTQAAIEVLSELR